MALIAAGRYVRTQNLFVLASRAARLLRVNRTSMVNALVANPSSGGIAEAKAEFAAMANRINGQILADVPSLQRTSSSVTVTASGNSAAIPATVHRNQIFDVQYSNSGNPLDMMPMNFIGKMDARRLPTMVQNGQVVGTYAQLVALDPTEVNLLFYPYLNQNTNFDVLFQAAPDVFVAADYDDAASTTYAVIPDEYNDVFASLLALEIAKVMQNKDRMEQLELDLFGKPQNGFIGMYEKFRRSMMKVEGIVTGTKYSYSNQHPNALATPYNGISFGSNSGNRTSY